MANEIKGIVESAEFDGKNLNVIFKSDDSIEYEIQNMTMVLDGNANSIKDEKLFLNGKCASVNGACNPCDRKNDVIALRVMFPEGFTFRNRPNEDDFVGREAYLFLKESDCE